MKVSNHIALALHIGGRIWHARGGGGIYPGGMINKICVKAALFNFFVAQGAGQLVDNGADHFEVG